MENTEQQILSEIKSMMASIRSQLEFLDAKMAQLQQIVGTGSADTVPIDLEIDMDAVSFNEMAPVEQTIPLAELDDDLPFSEEAVAECFTEEEPAEPEQTLLEEAAEEPVEHEDTSGPEEDAAQEPAAEQEQEQEQEGAVIDVLTAQQAWRKDMPGTPVKDIRSAISLHDRIIFINYLFNEDPLAFQTALDRINRMSSLDEAVTFAAEEHPEWDMDSDVIYRFMMAVRRRLR